MPYFSPTVPQSPQYLPSPVHSMFDAPFSSDLQPPASSISSGDSSRYAALNPNPPELSEPAYFSAFSGQSRPAELPQIQTRPVSAAPYTPYYISVSAAAAPPLQPASLPLEWRNFYAGPRQGLSRSQSAQSYAPLSATPSPREGYSSRLSLSPELRSNLSDTEQVRVLANSTPAFYDAKDRARRLQQSYQPGPEVSEQDTPHRRNSLPALPTKAQRQQVTPYEYVSANRPSKTPPLAPSARFASPTSPSASPYLASLPAVEGLETIGEDGESQAGTLRTQNGDNNGSGHLARSSSYEAIRSLKADKAANVDDVDNTSVTLLEALVDKQERERQADRNGASHPEDIEGESIPARPQAVDKTLPRPPVPSEKNLTRKEDRRGIFDIFPSLSASNTNFPFSTLPQETSAPPAKPSVALQPPSARRTSAPLAVGLRRPDIIASRSDTLFALEHRLSRPSATTPIGAALPPLQSVSALLPSKSIAPFQRAISIADIDSAGALKKESSQISLRSVEIVAPAEDPTKDLQTTNGRKPALENARSDSLRQQQLNKAETKTVDEKPEAETRPVGELEASAKEASKRKTTTLGEKQQETHARRRPLHSQRVGKQKEVADFMTIPVPHQHTTEEQDIILPMSPSKSARPSPAASPAFSKLSPAPLRARSATPRGHSPSPKPQKRNVSDPQRISDIPSSSQMSSGERPQIRRKS